MQPRTPQRTPRRWQFPCVASLRPPRAHSLRQLRRSAISIVWLWFWRPLSLGHFAPLPQNLTPTLWRSMLSTLWQLTPLVSRLATTCSTSSRRGSLALRCRRYRGNSNWSLSGNRYGSAPSGAAFRVALLSQRSFLGANPDEWFTCISRRHAWACGAPPELFIVMCRCVLPQRGIETAGQSRVATLTM